LKLFGKCPSSIADDGKEKPQNEKQQKQQKINNKIMNLNLCI
jgi:hypothetical protein